MPALHTLSSPRFRPDLHPGFRPLGLALRALRAKAEASGRPARLCLAIERGRGAVSRFDTTCLPADHPEAALNLEYAERIVKFLLWSRGGWRVLVSAPGGVAEHLKAVYSANGARAFDHGFMGGVYSHPFRVEAVEEPSLPAAKESTVALGGHLDGCRIGFDLGASDRKVSAVVDGTPVFTEEVAWDPRGASDPQYHYDELMKALRAAAAHLPRVDAIGGSSAGVYIDNRPRVGSLFRGIPKELFEARTANLFFELQEAWGGVPFEVVNDGEVTALAGAMSLEDRPVLGIALGSSQAAGYVTPGGEITSWLNELAFAPVDLDPHGPVDEWSGDRGVGANYFSQQAVFRLAPIAGIPVDDRLGLAERLKTVQGRLAAGEPAARRIWDAIGIYLGYALGLYAEFYELKHVLILGRVTSGSGGDLILSTAKEVLAAEYPDVAARARISLPDEKSRRVGQAVAAASLPAITRASGAGL
jgi:predicted NBD/HSP70 family sugar kinase